MPTYNRSATPHAAATPDQQLEVLLIEDNPGDARLVEVQLQEFPQFRLAHAATLRDGLERIKAGRFDVVLLDLSLPDSHGADTFEAVRLAAPTTSIVVLTGFRDEATALAMVQAGAQDYVVKGGFEGATLVRILRYAIERHHLLEAIEAARRRELEQKDRFLSHVSHELRSPLAVSFLYTTNVLDGVVGELTAEQREHLSVAVDGLRAQMRLIDELLATVRSDASLISIDRSALAMPALIAQTLRGFGARRDGITILDETDPDLPPVHADGKRIQQVLTNLIDNALKFSPPNTTIRIRAFPAPSEPGFVRIDVADEGPGLPENARGRVFDRLFHDEAAADGQNGLGLGLYLCKLLVRRHGGQIWVESAGDRGSRFSFTLPFLPSVVAAERRA